MPACAGARQSERCAAPRESVGAGAGGFLFIDYPSIQQVNAAFGMPREAGIVGDHADGRALLVQFMQQFHNSVRVLRIEIARRLVCQQDRWASRQGPRHGHALLLAA